MDFFPQLLQAKPGRWMALLSLHEYCQSTYTQKHPFNGPFSGTTQESRYQKGKTNLGFTEARGSEWQWHLLSHTQVCTSLQTDNHVSTPTLCFLQAGCPSCHPTNSVKALKAKHLIEIKVLGKNYPQDLILSKSTKYS